MGGASMPPDSPVDVCEDTFIYWIDLPYHLKIEVLRNLPFPTLWNFMFLSKECMALSSKLKPEVNGVFLLHEPNRVRQNANMGNCSATIIVYYLPRGSTDPDLRKNYTIRFTNINEGCTVSREDDMRIASTGPTYTNESCYAVSMRVLFNMTKYMKSEQISMEIGSVRTEVRHVLDELPKTASLCCERLTVHAHSLAVLTSLIPHVNPGCRLWTYDSDIFNIPANVFIDSDIFDLETVRFSQSFIM
ncbi:unnamed protein product [Cylicostephanus goldi]|uniref:F-box domain-containing protein n=1 Tax=Cylicostephanus goldi TaxID=71465 RepID=A0A3P7M2L9_CYLGO|nr:unnamed protein product [Cylicostephanus goldi]